MPTCPECQELLPPSGLSCSECGWSKRKRGGKPTVASRPKYLEPRTEDTQCRIHRITLDPTGYCAMGQAWWVPKFRCPACAGPLWDNGYCASCTPRTRAFPGDYFEQTWEDLRMPAYGHFLRVHTGPTPAPTLAQVDGYLAEMRALVGTVADALDANGQGVSRRLRGCRCERCVQHFSALAPTPEPAWIHAMEAR